MNECKNTPETEMLWQTREYEENWNSHKPFLSYRYRKKDSETISNVSEAHRASVHLMKVSLILIISHFVTFKLCKKKKLIKFKATLIRMVWERFYLISNIFLGGNIICFKRKREEKISPEKMFVVDALQFNFLSRIYFIGTMIKTCQLNFPRMELFLSRYSLFDQFNTEPTEKGRKSFAGRRKSWWTFIFVQCWFSDPMEICRVRGENREQDKIFLIAWVVNSLAGRVSSYRYQEKIFFFLLTGLRKQYLSFVWKMISFFSGETCASVRQARDMKFLWYEVSLSVECVF